MTLTTKHSSKLCILVELIGSIVSSVIAGRVTEVSQIWDDGIKIPIPHPLNSAPDFKDRERGDDETNDDKQPFLTMCNYDRARTLKPNK